MHASPRGPQGRFGSGGLAAAFLVLILIMGGAAVAPTIGLGAPLHSASAAPAGSPLLSASAAATTTATTTATVVATPTLTALPTTTATATVATATNTSVPLTATVTPTATATATPTVSATLAVTPTTVSQGGLTYATGTGFQPGEKINLVLGGHTLVQGQADVDGALPVTGVGVPFTTTTGTQVISATGATSSRVATATILVVALHPTLSASPTAVKPGTVVAVNGCSYGGGEGIVLALNGESLATTPTAITTTAAGCFSASLTVPSSLLAGSNALSASGVTSRATALVTLQGTLPVATTWYLAGGSTMTGETPLLSVVNPTGQPATVTLTVLYVSRAPDVTSLPVAAHSRQTVEMANIVGPGLHFGTLVSSDRDVSASLTELRANADQWIIPGVNAPNTTWYLAEGYTGQTFKETVTLLNPGTLPATVKLQLLPFNGQPPRTVSYTVSGQREVLVDVNALMPRLSLSVVATSDQPVVVERTMTFGTGDFGAHAKQGTTRSATSWYFAEGSTLNTFETYLTVLNPSSTQAADVTASYLSSTGLPLGTQTIHVDPLHRGNFKLNDVAHSSAIASIVSSNVPVVVERPMYFGSPNLGPTGGSVVFGRNGNGTSYTFPEGTTANTREFILLFNPSSTTAQVQATFYTPDGKVVTTKVAVPPFARTNIDVNASVPSLPAGDHGIVVASTNGVGIVAEHSVYDASFRSGDGSQGNAR